MFKQLTLVLLCLSFFSSCAQQDIANYEGNWIGKLPNKSSFNFNVAIEKLEADNYHLVIANEKILIDEKLKSTSKGGIQFDIDNQIYFNLKYSENKKELTGSIKTGKFYYYVSLDTAGDNKFTGIWNPFMLDNGLISDDISLYIEKNEGEAFVAYPNFGDQRFRGTYAGDFKMQNDILLFRDNNTGFKFRAKLLKNRIELDILLIDTIITKTNLTHSEADWEYETDAVDQDQNTNTPANLNDGLAIANISDVSINKYKLVRLIDSIHSKNLVNMHSILIAKENKLVFETYFDGFNSNIPHDLRSASKSISSAMIGIAIDDNIIESVDQKLYDFIPEVYQYTKDSLKSKIRIKDLLTMSSGLDVNNLAYEGYYQDPNNSKSWLTTVLEAPMVKEPGTYADYGSANPFLLGVYLNERLKKPLEVYMDEKLFAPLGITNYINQTDDTERTPYFGGGMLLTPRDLLKFGQLYLNKGKWNGKQIISENWVEESFKKHARLQDRNGNEYGYLWWHHTYTIDGKAIKTIEARGSGGQLISIIPELESVVVITAGNFRNRKGYQSRKILEEYILPAMIK